MFTVYLYSLAKDSNSTKQPTGTGTSFSCNILTPADIVAPVIEISATDLTGYNYAYVAEFHRYYFIEGISYNAGIWQLSCKCDVLATYKTQIGAESLYILRASNSYDGNITDNFYPPTADYSYDVQTQDFNSVPGDYASGYYVVNIAGTSTTGNSTLYQMTPAQFRSLVTQLYAAIGGYNLADVIPSVVKLFGGNPEKLVQSAMWFPFPFSNTLSVSDVCIGNWAPGNVPGGVAIACEIIINPLEDLDLVTFTINKHPQASSRGRYLNLAPYSNYTLFIPGAGAVNLDTSKLLNATGINIYRTMDAVTGQMLAWCRTTSTTTQLLCELTGQWGVPIKLSGTNSGANILTGAVSTVGAAVVTGGASAVAAMAGAGIGTIAGAISGATVSTGSGGSAVNIYQRPVRLDTAFFRIAGDGNAKFGKPYCRMATPSSLSGFMIAQKGDVPIAGTSAEADQIRSILEGGFYYE